VHQHACKQIKEGQDITATKHNIWNQISYLMMQL